ncbi:MAG: hypothetical protein Q9217_002368 [Psora testacea]
MTQEKSNLILTELRGQSIVLRDLNAILAGWPREVNRHLDKLRCDVDEWLDSAMGHSSKLKSLKEADFGLFGATWWPRAEYDGLRIVTFLAAWLDMDDGSLWDNFELSNPYRNETRDYVEYCLELTNDRQFTTTTTAGASAQYDMTNFDASHNDDRSDRSTELLYSSNDKIKKTTEIDIVGR